MQENIMHHKQLDLELSDLITKGYYNNPYYFYQQLRENNPVYRQKNGVWVLSKYQDVKYVVKDTKFKREGLEKLFGVERKPADSVQHNTPSMLRQDPPEHTRLRKAINKCFTKSAVESLEKVVIGFVDEILQKINKYQEYDIVSHLAYPLPIKVICYLMDIPDTDRAAICKWVGYLTKSFDVFDNVDRIKLINQGLEARQVLADYFVHLINRRKNMLGHDIISTLLIANADNCITFDEVVTMCILLFVAGHETTANLIANGLFSLLRSENQFNLLRQNLSLMTNAIEEFLRFESPVQRVACLADENITIGSQLIKKDSLIIALLGSANRDPEIFANPEVLDITRCNNRHLAFSEGTHFCLGAYLARFEANIVFSMLINRFKQITLSSKDICWNKSVTFRGLQSLPVKFE